jgi:UDP-glucose 4-epimerase
MNILVIGGAGFIGSHLCEKLADGNEVVSLDNYFTGRKENHVKGVKYIELDSKEIDLIPPPDIVFHLGEYSRVLTCYEDMEQLIESNYIGTMRVLEYCRKNKVRLVYAGSSTKFGDAESPYSYFKAQNTELIKKYAEWFGLDYAITYFYNVYGGREIKEGKYATVIGIFEKNRKNNKPHLINGKGDQRRNFTHVEDIVDGLITVGLKGKGEYCLGNEKDYTIYEVAQMFGGEILFVGEKKGDRKASKIDLDSIKQLGWKAKTDLKDYVDSLCK